MALNKFEFEYYFLVSLSRFVDSNLKRSIHADDEQYQYLFLEVFSKNDSIIMFLHNFILI